jgi:hypothetical protein
MKQWVLAGIVSAAVIGSAQAGDGSALDKAFVDARVVADARVRYEAVDQDGLVNDADALTLRLRSGFVTGEVSDTRLGIDFEWVESLISNYNSTTNGKTFYPVVADPEDAELNQFYLQNKSLPGTTLTVGRQRLILDDARFVGNVGWRQNEQTYDAVRLTNTSIDGVTVDVAYINQVNRVFGPDSAVSPWNGDSFLANVSHDLAVGRLTGFAYLIDLEEAPANASQTYGLRFAGQKALRAATVKYALSYATQSDDGKNPINYSADYCLIDVGVDYAGATFGAAYEVLGGDGVKGFATPLATLHKFQGWTDKFLTTPAGGVADLSFKAGYGWKDVGPFRTVDTLAVYHDFEAARGGAAYGTEIGFMVKAAWRKMTFIAKYADYDAKSFATDTQKFWLEAAYSF